MAEREKQDPTTAEEQDISKAQSAQQPQVQAGQQSETSEQRQAADQPDEGLQGETLAKLRSDIEGASQQPKERAEEEAGFIGTEGQRDTSSELIEDEGGDYVPEGK